MGSSSSTSRDQHRSASQPQVSCSKSTITFHHTLCDGSEGAVAVGTYDGVPAVVKLIYPDEHGLDAFNREVAAYQLLASFQGGLIPQLLGAGQVRAGVHFIAVAKVSGRPLSSFSAVPTHLQQAAVSALSKLHSTHPGFLHGDIRLENVMAQQAACEGGAEPAYTGCMLIDFGRSCTTGASSKQQKQEVRELKRLMRMG